MEEYDASVAATRAALKQAPETGDFIRYATLAANSHNTQPWRFKVSERRDRNPARHGAADSRSLIRTITICSPVSAARRKTWPSPAARAESRANSVSTRRTTVP